MVEQRTVAFSVGGILMTARSDRFAEHGCGRTRRDPMHVILAVFVGVALLAVSNPSPAAPGDSGLSFEPGSFDSRANPPLPDPSVYPVQMVLDDDNAEGVFGFSGSTARQFLWFNRFASPGPFELQEIWVLFPGPGDVPIGGAIELAVYLDPDGDPTNGAQLLGTFPGTVQAANGDDFSIYTLAAPLTIMDTGDVLIGVVNRYFTAGTPPPTQPAALDITTSQDRSYFAVWSGDVPASPELGTAIVVELLDGQISGNFMIRGFGRQLQLPGIPTLSWWGLFLFIAVVTAVGVLLTRPGAR